MNDGSGWYILSSNGNVLSLGTPICIRGFDTKMLVFFPTQFRVIYTTHDSYFQNTAFADWSF
jgi:hypothetical protein